VVTLIRQLLTPTDSRDRVENRANHWDRVEVRCAVSGRQ
jgi:hypothetical protein